MMNPIGKATHLSLGTQELMTKFSPFELPENHA